MRRLGWLAPLVLVTACGAPEGPGPEAVAEAFARDWTEARCDAAMKSVQAPDDSWQSSCERTFSFGIECPPQVPGDPKPVDCGPGTKISVRSATITSVSEKDGTADVAVLVAYTQGRSTRESRTLRVALADSGGWKVVSVG